MSEGLYRTERGNGRLRRSWLVKSIEGYCRELAGRGYKRSTLRVYASRLVTFGDFVASTGARRLNRVIQLVRPFVESTNANHNRRALGSIIRGFVRHLVRQGVVPAPQPPIPRCSRPDLIDDYARFLHEHRGLCGRYVQNIRRCCESLLNHLGRGGKRLDSAGPRAVQCFLTLQGKLYQRTTMSSRCGIMRGFLTYLYRRNVIPINLSPLVVSPRVFRHEQCPRFLTRSQVQAVLAAIDQGTPLGRRDYAMMMLLATYGLRGIEAIRLRLDDIDWRKQVLHVRRRKAGNNTSYPLDPSVAGAIIAYLRHGRPTGAHAHREVFLSSRAPFGPVQYSANLGCRVRHYLAEVTVTIDRPGTHTFRYSCAQRLLDRGSPLKIIGDYLGHGSPDSTQRYTKIAIEQLREIARGDGEDLL